MSDRTGRALGTLSPVIYFKNTRGHIILPPVEIGHGPELARELYVKRFRGQGYEWCEAGTLSEVDRLQEMLVAQESRVLAEQGQRMDQAREAVRRDTSSSLRQRMSSSSCSPYEREFIELWFRQNEQNRKVFMQRFSERNQYLWAREMDTHTRVEDRMGSD